MNQALAQRGGPRVPTVAPSRSPALVPLATIGSVAGASALVAVAVVTGQLWILVPALGLGALGSLPFLARFRTTRAAKVSPTRAHVGMGATVASDAVLEPGAIIEMGVTVKSVATIRSGAVVKWGATIGERAIVERGAIVSWGATVHEGAVVGEGSTVGAGADVSRGAKLPPQTTLSPGATWRADRAEPAPTAKQADPRDERVKLVCDRLKVELRATLPSRCASSWAARGR